MRSNTKFSQRKTSRLTDVCPSTCTRVNRPLKRVARAGCPDDNDAVATLPDNWTPRHSGPILANYLKQREHDHKTVLNDITSGAAAVNEDINKRVRELAENLLTHIQENQRNIDCMLDRCENKPTLPPDVRDKTLKEASEMMAERLEFIANFKQDALRLERERADKLRILLRCQFQRLVAVGHRTPKDLLHEFDDRIYDINQQLLSNSKAYTNLEADLRGMSDEGMTRVRSSLNQLCLGIGMAKRGRSALIWNKDQRISRQRSLSALHRFSSGDPPGHILDHVEELNALISLLVEAYRNSVLKMFSGFSNKLTEVEKGLGNQDLLGPKAISKVELLDLDRFLERQLHRVNNALMKQPNNSLLETTGADVLAMQESVRKLTECLRETCSILNHAGHLWDAHILRSALAQKLTIAAVEDLLTSHDLIELANEVPFNIALEQLRCAPDADKLQQQFDAICVLLEKTAAMYLQHSEAELGRLMEFMNLPASMANVLLAEFDVFLDKYPKAPIQVLASSSQPVERTPSRSHSLPSVKMPLPRAIFQTNLQESALMNWRNGFLETFKSNIATLPEELRHQAQQWVEQRSTALHMRYSLKLVSHTIRLERIKAARDARLAELRYHDQRLESHLGAISELVERLPEEASTFAPMLDPFYEGIKRLKVKIDNISNQDLAEVKKMKMKSYAPRLAKHRQLFEESLDVAIVEYKKLLEHRIHEARISNVRYITVIKLFNEGGQYAALEATKTSNALGKAADSLELCLTKTLDVLSHRRSQLLALADQTILPLQRIVDESAKMSGKSTTRITEKKKKK